MWIAHPRLHQFERYEGDTNRVVDPADEPEIRRSSRLMEADATRTATSGYFRVCTNAEKKSHERGGARRGLVIEYALGPVQEVDPEVT